MRAGVNKERVNTRPVSNYERVYQFRYLNTDESVIFDCELTVVLPWISNTSRDARGVIAAAVVAQIRSNQTFACLSAIAAPAIIAISISSILAQ